MCENTEDREAADINIKYVVEPVRDIARVISEYLFNGEAGVKLTPSQEHVVNALLCKIEELCTEELQA